MKGEHFGSSRVKVKSTDMDGLNKDWLTEGLIDFEYKKYLLLAYLKKVARNFDENRLYPFLAELVAHYSNLVEFKRNKEQVAKHFPTKLTKIDLQKMTLQYEQIMNDDQYMEEIAQTLEFAIPLIKQNLENGKEIYEFVEEKIEIEPVGILPLHKEEGYMLLSNGNLKDIDVYAYQLTLFESAKENFRAIKTVFLTSYRRKITNTVEFIKLDMIRSNRHLPNPATYHIRSEKPFPMLETMLPVAKRSFVRYLGQA